MLIALVVLIGVLLSPISLFCFIKPSIVAIYGETSFPALIKDPIVIPFPTCAFNISLLIGISLNETTPALNSLSFPAFSIAKFVLK